MINFNRSLGRRAPSDWEHVDKYPLTASRLEEITAPRPIVIGVNWYTNFDHPVQDAQGHYWIGRGNLGSIRGGHCVCLKPKNARDSNQRWEFYNQGDEGACVGFGVSRMMTFFNGKLYLARWLWDKAKEIDEWSDTVPGDDNGTSVRAALDVLRTQGHVVWKNSYESLQTNWQGRDQLVGKPAEGIAANRWITSMDDALQVLGYTGLDYVDICNSWGRDYPHLVRMPVTTLETLWKEDGEIGVATDR
jgi:hypothetical protein